MRQHSSYNLIPNSSLPRLATRVGLSLILIFTILAGTYGPNVTAQSDDTAQYRVTFTSTWSAQTHPTDFPSSNPHFSGLIGGTHNSSVTFWAPGGLATQGIETMAESGGTGDLRDEVEDAINDGNAERVLAGGGLGDSPDSTTYDFTISKEYPLVTLVSMIAPSPDWFVGVHGQSLLNNQGDWITTLEVTLDPYDAGTDSSPSYLHSEDDTNPQEEITNLRGSSPFADASIGSFTFERLDGPDDPTATPSDTPIPPTETPIPPTNTSTPTTTPTNTPIATNTPLPPTNTPTATDMPTPSVMILAPANNATVELPFMLDVQVENWSVEPLGKHYHWLLDGIDQGPSFSRVPVTISDIPLGTHQITVELSEQDHSFINVSDTITISVVAPVVEPTAMPTAMPTNIPTAEPTVEATTTPGGVEASMAQYQVTFSSTWSGETHPPSIPGSAHYSPLIGATHNDQVSFWVPGEVASDGIEDMAETGGTSSLRAEIQTAIDSQTAEQIIRGGGLGSSPGMINTQPFTVSRDYPLLTLVTMIAPSPDWFVGVHDYSLLDENGDWKTEVEMELFPYDAGSDDGTEYTSGNADTNPKQTITNLTGVAPFSSQPLGSFSVTLLQTIGQPTEPVGNLDRGIYLPVR